MKTRLILLLFLGVTLRAGAEELILEKKTQLKEAPQADSRLLKDLDTGTRLFLLGNSFIPGEIGGISGEWIPVQFENTTGWIFRAEEKDLQEILIAGKFTGLWKEYDEEAEVPDSFLELNKNGFFEWLEGETGFSGEWYCDIPSALLTFQNKGLGRDNYYFKIKSCTSKEIVLQQVDDDGHVLEEPRTFLRE